MGSGLDECTHEIAHHVMEKAGCGNPIDEEAVGGVPFRVRDGADRRARLGGFFRGEGDGAFGGNEVERLGAGGEVRVRGGVGLSRGERPGRRRQPSPDPPVHRGHLLRGVQRLPAVPERHQQHRVQGRPEPGERVPPEPAVLGHPGRHLRVGQLEQQGRIREDQHRFSARRFHRSARRSQIAQRVEDRHTDVLQVLPTVVSPAAI